MKAKNKHRHQWMLPEGYKVGQRMIGMGRVYVLSGIDEVRGKPSLTWVGTCESCENEFSFRSSESSGTAYAKCVGCTREEWARAAAGRALERRDFFDVPLFCLMVAGERVGSVPCSFAKNASRERRHYPSLLRAAWPEVLGGYSLVEIEKGARELVRLGYVSNVVAGRYSNGVAQYGFVSRPNWRNIEGLVRPLLEAAMSERSFPNEEMRPHLDREMNAAMRAIREEKMGRSVFG